MINKELKKYIEENIFPLYNKVDKGHNLENHIISVINGSIELAKTIPNINLDIVYTVAAFHDAGLIYDRENHHLNSANFVLKDKHLNKWFQQDDIKIIAEAVEDHRAHYEPRNIYGQIISDADKSVDLKDILIRTHLGIKSKFPDKNLETFEAEFNAAYDWILKKDSEKGYMKFYLDDDKKKALIILHNLVKNKDYIKKEYYKIYKESDYNEWN